MSRILPIMTNEPNKRHFLFQRRIGIIAQKLSPRCVPKCKQTTSVNLSSFVRSDFS